MIINSEPIVHQIPARTPPSNISQKESPFIPKESPFKPKESTPMPAEPAANPVLPTPKPFQKAKPGTGILKNQVSRSGRTVKPNPKYA